MTGKSDQSNPRYNLTLTPELDARLRRQRDRMCHKTTDVIRYALSIGLEIMENQGSSAAGSPAYSGLSSVAPPTPIPATAPARTGFAGFMDRVRGKV